MNYYRFYPGDYSRDTGHLSLVEHGAYLILLNTYYATGRPLANAMRSHMRLCRATTKEEIAAVQKIVKEFFYLGKDGLLHNQKADELLAADSEKIKKAKNSANARWHNECERNANALRTQCSPAPAPTASRTNPKTVLETAILTKTLKDLF